MSASTFVAEPAGGPGDPTRRDFLRFCGFMTAVLALPPGYVSRIEQALQPAPVRP